MARSSPHPALVAPDLARPMTLEMAETALDGLRHARHDLFAGPPPENARRGIDVLRRDDLPTVFRQACNSFFRAHGRFPDLITPRSTVDHFFALKFFHPIPLPLPADKLEAKRHAPAEVLRDVGLARRPWIGTEPALPPDEALPPGHYVFKISNGNAMQMPVDWPPSRQTRAAAAKAGRAWRRIRYGVHWGEWWYACVRPRFFLEEDLSDAMAGRPECKIFVREGVPRLLFTVRQPPGGPRRYRLFTPELTPLEGTPRGARGDDVGPPERIGLMLRAAAEIGRGFRLVRVDFLNARGPKPILGELTLCHQNALQPYVPRGLDAEIRRRLFE
jgi:hypothetical protein